MLPRVALCAAALWQLLLQPAAAQLVRTKRQTCKLQSIILRSGNRPVDLLPPYDPNTFTYFATLNFDMDSFSIDAVPFEGCMKDKVPNQAIPVNSDGKAVAVTVFAKSRNATKEFEGLGTQEYTVEVSRLMGTETQVNALRVPGAISMSPPFQELRRSYAVLLGIGYDLVVVEYVLRDDGQSVRCAASPQVRANSSNGGGWQERRLLEVGEAWEEGREVAPAVAPAVAPSVSVGPGGAGGRRLMSAGQIQTGEVQNRWRHQVFPMDAGFSRRVTLTIESADPMEARVDTYTLDVRRESCTAAKPFYDPISRTCVTNCPDRYYMNVDIDRCSECNTNCRVCVSLLQCELCYKDNEHSEYLLLDDGSCRERKTSLLDKYYWWCMSFAIFVGFLLLIGVASVCQCLCSLCCSCCFDRSQGYTYDTDSDGGDFDSERYG